MSIKNFLVAGGIVAWPLLVFSLLGVALIIERIIFWYRIKSRERKIITTVLKLYQGNEPIAAIAKLKQNADLPMCRIFLEALVLQDATPTEFRLALETATQAELPLFKRFNTIFQTIIAVSPLLGLLGTILGLMRSFASLDIGNVSGTNATNVTGGISEALTSTVMGLVVAIMTLLFANSFRSLYLQQFALVQEYAGQLELLYRRFYERGDKPYAVTR
ncbi:putative biopolymer transport protein [Crocosphaera subtropica ATCC 51142]|uniref:Biopolymer transport protein n=1 Tax=Crocosphaera subtropica (strain ATCC 51142 / BH68) TaxID=43989 RepID=B1WWT3_CROS5|nr:MotA/TolQ/ExbB proton channel family protein [Crocosphaera subtropica]ACB52402.1 putative biopolymer transport protein [Crocosphaera subtropica ATCC 51142]